jgi:DNA-binding CsgD family transcriptional regulator
VSADSRRLNCAHLMTPAWQERLRQGVRARVLAAIELDEMKIPLELIARVELQDHGQLSIEIALPDPPEGAEATNHTAVTITRRERAVIDVVAMGKSSDEIAALLGISPATVRTHVRNAMAKVGARTRAQLIAIVLADAPQSAPAAPAVAHEA